MSKIWMWNFVPIQTAARATAAMQTYPHAPGKRILKKQCTAMTGNSASWKGWRTLVDRQPCGTCSWLNKNKYLYISK